MSKLEKSGIIAGVLSALIALISLMVTAIQLRSDIQRQRINEWQEVAVFALISEAPQGGLNFDEIRNQYKVKAADLPEELPRSEIQSQALTRTLLGLMAKRAISMRSDGKYAVVLDAPPVEVLDEINKNARLQPLGEALVSAIVLQPGHFSREELEELMKGRFSFTEEEFTRVLSVLAFQGTISIDEHGKMIGYGSHRSD